jgi:hypothetical protein
MVFKKNVVLGNDGEDNFERSCENEEMSHGVKEEGRLTEFLHLA